MQWAQELLDAVARGAALLDEAEPGWRDRISPAQLKMDICARCVIGQVYGLEEGEDSYRTGMAYRWHLGALVPGGQWEAIQEDYGFALPDNMMFSHESPDSDALWKALRVAWLGIIKGEEVTVQELESVA